MCSDDDAPTGERIVSVYADYIARCRTGEREARIRRRIRRGWKPPDRCGMCGRVLDGGRYTRDGLCTPCRRLIRRRERQERNRKRVWALCHRCGRRCERRDDGLCGKCRNNDRRRTLAYRAKRNEKSRIAYRKREARGREKRTHQGKDNTNE